MQLDKVIWLEFPEKNSNINLIPVLFATYATFLDAWLSVQCISLQYLSKVKFSPSFCFSEC